jgi:hypothetical protein
MTDPSLWVLRSINCPSSGLFNWQLSPHLQPLLQPQRYDDATYSCKYSVLSGKRIRETLGCNLAQT